MDIPATPQATRILDCAQALIATGGYNGFSYADISAEVGITKASIHHHFPKKEDLVVALLKRYRQAGAEGMAALAASGASPLASLQAYVSWWSDCIADATRPICICAMLGAELPALPAAVADQVQQHFTGLAAWLESVMSAGVENGQLHLHSAPGVQAQMFLATAHGAMISARACRDPHLFALIAGPLVERMAAGSATAAA